MKKIDSDFNLRGSGGETITVRVNDQWPVAGVGANVGPLPLASAGAFSLPLDGAMLTVQFDFAQTVGDSFLLAVTGSDAESDVISVVVKKRTNPTRIIGFRLQA